MSVDEIAKEYNCDTAKYLGIFEGKKAYLLKNSKIGNNGMFSGLPYIVVEKGKTFELLNNKELADAMRLFFKPSV